MANQKILEQKKVVINEIAKNIKDSKTSVWFEYRGLTVDQMTEIRRGLKATDSDIKIYKNTLVKRALDSLNIEIDEHLSGPKAVAFGNDAIAPIKVLSEFSKKYPALEMKVGIVEGSIAPIGMLNQLASIPSRDVLLTQLASSLMGTVRNLSICLDLYSQKLEK